MLLGLGGLLALGGKGQGGQRQRQRQRVPSLSLTRIIDTLLCISCDDFGTAFAVACKEWDADRQAALSCSAVPPSFLPSFLPSFPSNRLGSLAFGENEDRRLRRSTSHVIRLMRGERDETGLSPSPIEQRGWFMGTWRRASTESETTHDGDVFRDFCWRKGIQRNPPIFCVSSHNTEHAHVEEQEAA